jgi:hypothetical protein
MRKRRLSRLRLIRPDLIELRPAPGNRINSNAELSPRIRERKIYTSPGCSQCCFRSHRPDGRHLFLASERPGLVAETVEGRRPGDIYQVELRALRGITWPDQALPAARPAFRLLVIFKSNPLFFSNLGPNRGAYGDIRWYDLARIV